MKKLCVFGDSYSTKFELKDKWAEKYITWKGYIPKTYSSIISESMNIEVMNKAVVGKDNYSIFEQIWENAENVQQDDIIIIGWSDVLRFRLSSPSDSIWKTFIPNSRDNDFNSCNITKNTFNDILNNRTDKIYEFELSKIVNFVNFVFKTQKIIHWRWDNVGRLKNYSTILDETNGEIQDLHYSEKGHKDLSINLMECINSENRVNNLCKFI